MTEREKRFARALGRRIQGLRTARRWTQKQLGDAIGVDHWQISRYEKGKSSASGMVVQRLAEVLEVTADELLGLTPLRPQRVGDALSELLAGLEEVPAPHRSTLCRLIGSFLKIRGIALPPHPNSGASRSKE
jgi:transcriptional regulator with XRE-family HTH domain